MIRDGQGRHAGITGLILVGSCYQVFPIHWLPRLTRAAWLHGNPTRGLAGDHPGLRITRRTARMRAPKAGAREDPALAVVVTVLSS